MNQDWTLPPTKKHRRAASTVRTAAWALAGVVWLSPMSVPAVDVPTSNPPLEDLAMRQAREAVSQKAWEQALTLLQGHLRAAPDDADAKVRFDTLKQELLALEGAELRERQKAYPTDRSIKAELGRIEFELGNYEDAMAAFQASKDDPKLRVNSAWMLGRCFAKEGWHSEAVGEYKEAIAALDNTQADRELDIRYDLMLSLIELAKAEKSPAHAKEAADICSAIVRKNISFRDVRAKRKEVDELVRTLG